MCVYIYVIFICMYTHIYTYICVCVCVWRFLSRSLPIAFSFSLSFSPPSPHSPLALAFSACVFQARPDGPTPGMESSGICGHLSSRSKVMRLPTEILTWTLAPRYPQVRLPSMVRRLKEARAFDCSKTLCQKHTPPDGFLPRLSLSHT